MTQQLPPVVRDAWDRLDPGPPPTTETLRGIPSNETHRGHVAVLAAAAAVVLVIVTALSLTATLPWNSPPGPVAPPTPSISLDDLAGVWVLTDATYEGVHYPVTDPRSVTSLVLVSPLGGQAITGCQVRGVRAEIEGESLTLTVSDPGSMLSCPPGSTDPMHGHYGEALSSVDHASVSGTQLHLTGPGTDLVFRLHQASSPTPPGSETASPSGHLTLEQAERQFPGQRFRPYTGPTPPTISEADALSVVAQGSPNFYSLGTIDVGMVHTNGQVDWHHVWVIAGALWVPDVHACCSPVVSDTTPSAQPGWMHLISLIDVTDGSLVVQGFY